MDTGPEYVAMCKQATEIQLLRDVGCVFNTSPDLPERAKIKFAQSGDCFWDFFFDKPRWFAEDNPHVVTFDTDCGKGLVWLPRQDQLQAMVFGGLEIGEGIPSAMLKLLYEYGHVINNKTVEKWHNCKTMEQLWLGFVMWELYQKQWDGKDWVKV